MESHLPGNPWLALGEPVQMAAPVETRILTVPTANANDELRVRQTFGWQLAQASARSFATGAGVVGGATDIGGAYLGAAHVNMHNAHYTDLTLIRHASPRNQWLANLEESYDSITFLPNASHWLTVIIAGVVFAIGLFGSAGVASALGKGDESVSPLRFLIPLAVGIVLGVLATNARQRRRIAENQRREAVQLKILNQARGART